MSAEEKSMSIIVTKGSLDWAYPPFILATTAAAMGVPVTMFFTFYGLPLLLKALKLQLTTQEFFDGEEHCESINPDEIVAYGDAVHVQQQSVVAQVECD